MKFNHSTALAAAILAALGSAAADTAQAADFRIYGLVNTGLYYTKAKGDNGNLKLAGIGETPWDSAIHFAGREDLGNGRYIAFNLGTTFDAGTGSMASSGVLFDASRIMIGNENIEFAIGRIGGFTVATEPYSVYMRLNTNMTSMQLAGIAPANITYRPARVTNAIAFATPMNKFGPFVQAIYSNGDSNGTLDEETTYDWSDRNHVFQAAAGWTSEKLKLGAVYSWEMPSNYTQGAERHDAMNAVHLIASWDFGGPGLSVIAFAGWDMMRLGAAQDMNQMLGQGSDTASIQKGNSVINESSSGLDAQALVITGMYPMGRHQFSFSTGYLQGDWKGSTEGVEHDDGSLWQAGVGYRYFFSKKANWYAAASYADGNRLFGKIARFNQVMATTGIAVSF